MKVATYTLTLQVNRETAETRVDAVNDGFSALEVLGLLDWKREDIIAQMRGKIIPDTVKRTVIAE